MRFQWSTHRADFLARFLCAGVCVLGMVSGVLAQNQAFESAERHWVDDFETQLPKWIDVGGDCAHRLTLRLREEGDAMSGRGFEHLRVQTETEGSAVYLAYPLSPAEVRQNLLVQLAVRANRSGIQLLTRVVFPMVRDPKTGGAVTFYVSGGTYSSVNRWQKLRIDDILRQVQQEIMRHPELSNARNAYIDRVVLNVYTGPGELDLEVDSLEISGVIPVSQEFLAQNPQGTTFSPVSESSTTPVDSSANGKFRDFPPVTSGDSASGGASPGLKPAVTYDLFQENSSGSGTNDSAQGAGNPGTLHPADSQESVPPGTLVQPSGGNSASGASPSTQAVPSPSPQTVPVPPNPEIVPSSGLNRSEMQSFQPKEYDIRLNRSIVTVNGTPILVRAIRHHGESLEFLASLGFNTIWLEAPPTRQMEVEAALLNLWFICPPPVDLSDPDVNPSQAVQTQKLNGCLVNRVLTWDLGKVPTINDVKPGPDGKPGNPTELARKQTNLLNQVPTSRLPHRPNIVIPNKDLPTYSSVYDILMIDRNPLNSTLGFVSYGLWFREILNLVPAGQSIFVKVPTEYDPLLQAQWKQMQTRLGSSSGLEPIPKALPVEQLRLLTYNVVMAGTRGILFESSSRLDAKDRETVFRARSLELVNREILILEQWISQGEKYTTLPSNHKDVAGSLLATNHVRILFPMVLEPTAQYVSGAGADRQITFLVRGLPETYQCWQYSLNGLSPLVNRREAGGVAVNLEELPLVSTIVMTQNSIIINSISQRIARFAPRLAELMKELATMRLENWLQQHGAKKLDDRDEMYYRRAKLFLDGAEKAFYAHEYADAFTLAQRSMRPIAYLEQQAWGEKTAQFPTPNFLPAAVTYRTLPLLDPWLNLTSGLNRGRNVLPGGEFDDLRQVPATGWRQLQSWNAYDGITPRADIAEEAAHSGPCGLKLEVTMKDKNTAPVMFDSPPVVIRSPAVEIGPVGTVYQLELWVNIPVRLQNTVEGLKITDSNSGEVLAERRMKTNGWQKIAFQRVVTDSNPVFVTIALTGYGTVYVDDVRLIPLE
ncbi:MAG: hypothetical protein K6C40_02240 [Thermoguttaceae bacterium]|nr:hypothetical protein [Thermoguttaceae bacterium]